MKADLDVMHAVKNGDIRKVGVLFERYKTPLFGYFYRNTNNQQVSEDLVQSVFYRIIKYRKNFRGEGKFTTWMYRIAHNLLYDTQYKKKSLVEKTDNIICDPADPEDSEDILIDKENMRILSKAMGLLRQDRREILILSKYQNLKYREIGNILNCTESTVKVRIFRALADLRKIYITLEGSIQ